MNGNGLGSRIEMARKSAGLRREAVAVALGVSAQTVWNYETGATTPSLGRLTELAQFLNVEAGWLIDGDKEAA